MQKYIAKFQDLDTGKNFSDVSIREVFEGTTSDLAVARPISDAHNIIEIVNHSINWRQFLIEKIQGNENFEITQDSPLDWNKVFDENDMDWEEVKSGFVKQQLQLLELLSSFSEADLKQTVPNRKYDFTYLIEGIIEHDYYHFGQVKLLMNARV